MQNASPICAYLEKPSMVDYPRRFAAVFFIGGCGFTCGFCHNASLMGRKQDGLSWNAIESACADFKRNWVNGAVITGGEPTLAEELTDVIRLLKEQYGFTVKLDTNGSNPDRLAECLPLVDYVAMDIKCGLASYPEVTGFTAVEKIVQSIDLIRCSAKDYEFRTTVIAPLHTDTEMEDVYDLVRGSRRYILRPSFPAMSCPMSATAAPPAPPPPGCLN